RANRSPAAHAHRIRTCVRVLIRQDHATALDREIDQLFALPLEQFTAARNQLARRLKQEGKPDDAERVRTLPKPSSAVWAINQAARADREAVRALLKAGEELRRVQARALAGPGAGEKLRSAAAHQHEALRR